MKVKELVPIIFKNEKMRNSVAPANVVWRGDAYLIPKKYYNYDIDKVCSFPCEYTNSCTYIFIK